MEKQKNSVKDGDKALHRFTARRIFGVLTALSHSLQQSLSRTKKAFSGLGFVSPDLDASFLSELLKACNFNRLRNRESGMLTKKYSVIKSGPSV